VHKLNKVRVLVANRPRLMREVVLATLAGQPDIEVVGESQDENEITEVVERVRPDFVIIALEEPESRPGICGFLLGRYPQMKVVAVAPEKNITVCYWAFVDLRSKRFQTSEESLLGILRGSTLMPESVTAIDEKQKTLN
jgi:hypothetical protein